MPSTSHDIANSVWLLFRGNPQSYSSFPRSGLFLGHCFLFLLIYLFILFSQAVLYAILISSMSNSDADHVSHGPVATAVEYGDPAAFNHNATTKTHSLKNRLPEKRSSVVDDADEESISSGPHKPVFDHTHRRLKPRHVQLIGISISEPQFQVYSGRSRLINKRHRYWRDDWDDLVCPNRPGSCRRRSCQSISGFYHLVSHFPVLAWTLLAFTSMSIHLVQWPRAWSDQVELVCIDDEGCKHDIQ